MKDVDDLIADRYTKGLSLREISQYILARTGIKRSHVQISKLIDAMIDSGRLRRRVCEPARTTVTLTPSGSHEPRLAPVASQESLLRDLASREVGPDAHGVTTEDAIIQMLRELDDDISAARTTGATASAMGTLMKLKADLLSRRDALSPPTPPDPDKNADAITLGERTVAKLRSMVAAALDEELAK